MSDPLRFHLCYLFRYFNLPTAKSSRKIREHSVASALFCVLSINEKVMDVFFNFAKRCVNTL